MNFGRHCDQDACETLTKVFVFEILHKRDQICCNCMLGMLILLVYNYK